MTTEQSDLLEKQSDLLEKQEGGPAFDPDGPLIVASVSGGKDSTAMALHLLEQGYRCRFVFADTGWEDRQTYDYITDVLEPRLGKIERVRCEVSLDEKQEAVARHFEERLGHHSAMVRSCIKKRIFPSRMVRWCTFNLKVDPIKRYIRSIEEDKVNAVGVRAAESRARSRLPAVEDSKSFKCPVWRPILSWKTQDVIDIHSRHGLRPNPKYLQGAERVGCWPCVYARKSEIRRFGMDDERVSLLRDLEVAITRLQDADRKEKGLHEIPPNGWFQSRNQYVTDETGRKFKDGTRWPIDKAVEWSRTSRGGRQFELFATTVEESGCVQWGLCDRGLVNDDQEEP